MPQGEVIARIRYQTKSGYCDISQTAIVKALREHWPHSFNQLDVKLITDPGLLVRDRTLEMLEFSIREMRKEIARARTGNVQGG